MAAEISPAGALRASHADRDAAVDVLRVAAGEGRLTADELDERVEAALAARTLAQLAPLTADLPGGAPVREAKEVLRIAQRFSPVERTGRWAVPRRLELEVEWSDVTLDLTEAETVDDVLRIDLDMTGKTLTLITAPGTVVDTDELRLEFCKVKDARTTAADLPAPLRIELAGTKRFGTIALRSPRRSRWRRRPAG